MAIPTFVAGNILTAAQLNTISSALPIVDAWTSYTPQVDQGVTSNIAKTVTYARYIKVGRMVHAQVSVSMTGTGTSGSAIAVSIPPFTPVDTSFPVAGSGVVFDADVALLRGGLVVLASTTRINFWTVGGGAAGVGVGPAMALAIGDVIKAEFRFESTT